ncbi:MAG TPA: dCTP deaminase [Candidatus Bathyarchaeia archaeon]|jgi:dCTP deaminase|nr:dCTP deaminase [Candidatus Bathyarchaeia archaeon]
MVLSDKEIALAIKNGELGISPRGFRINPAGVDLRIDRSVRLKPKQQLLAASIERVELSDRIVGFLHLRSSLAREGLIAGLALVDPGFRGQLTVSLYNAGDSSVNLAKGERFIQLSLLRLGEPAINRYAGRYQDSSGVVASRRKKRSSMKRIMKRMESVIP